MARRMAIFAAAALVLAACGGGEGEDSTTTVTAAASTTVTEAATTTAPTTTAAPVDQDGSTSPQLASIRAALSQSAEIASGRMEGSIQVWGAGADPALDLLLPFGGAFDTATGNSTFFVDLSALAAAAAAAGEEVPAEFADAFGTMEVRVVDGISYISFPFFALVFAAETQWISAPADEGTDLASDFTFVQPDNPAEMLSMLEDADAEVEEVGRETVNGVSTTHYRVVFDTAALYEAASPEERAELEEGGLIPEGEFPVELWISDDGLIVRYIMDVDGSAITSPEGDAFERMVVTFNLLDIDQPVNIVAPDPADVTDMGALAGGLFGMPGG